MLGGLAVRAKMGPDHGDGCSDFMFNSSYRNVLKATSLLGGSSLITLLIGMVRTKFVAVLLGPAGIGFVTVYTAIVGLVSTFSSLGLDSSGVRKIAEAHGLGDESQIARIVTMLIRVAWVTGIVGMLVVMVGSEMLSVVSFGTGIYAWPIGFLGLAVLFGNAAIGQSCILQGTRRVGSMAKVGIVGAINGVALSIPCYYFLGLQGIVPGLILSAIALWVTNWLFSRKIVLTPAVVSWSETRAVAWKLLSFGLPVMLSSVVTAITGYFVRALLVRQVGLDGVGIWQAAFTLSGVLVNFVLGAMVWDYYPRLVAVVGDNKRVHEAVNAQTEIALLLAAPGLAATIIFAPLAITLFYSGKFDLAVEVLRWSVYGVLGRIIAWPLGLVLLAKGMGKTHFCTESFGNLFYIAAIWACTHLWGLPGAGVAFLVLYLVNAVVIGVVMKVACHTTWNRANLLHILAFVVVLAGVGIVSALIVNPWLKYFINIIILGGLSAYCLRLLAVKSGITWQMIKDKIK
jgi:antigen flippase